MSFPEFQLHFIETPMSLQKEEGIFEMFLHLLWMKDSIFNEDHFEFHIPDTIVIRNEHPVFWYFSDEEGTIRKKKNKNVRIKKIFKAFLEKNVSKSGVVAMNLYPNPDKSDPKRIVVEYLDEEGFSKSKLLFEST